MKTYLAAALALLLVCGSSPFAQAQVTCSSFSNGNFILYYGTDPVQYNKIIADAPAFVILGDHKGNLNADLAEVNYFKNNGGQNIKLIEYIPMNYGDNGDHGVAGSPQCGGTVQSDGGCFTQTTSFDCTKVSIQTRIDNAIDAGYDGIFFDEAPSSSSKPNFISSCASSVKGFSANKIVIMNPGSDDGGQFASGFVDMVSVENHFNVAVPGGHSAWQWLAVDTNVNDTSRIDTFRTNGGFWYYGNTTSQAVATNYSGFVRSETACQASGGTGSGGSGGGTGSGGSGGGTGGSGGGGTCPVAQPTCPSGTFPVGIHDFNKANNVELCNYFTTLQPASGGTQQNAFSNAQYCVTPGTYKVTAQGFGTVTFDHWDDFSTAQPRTVTVTNSPSGTWLGAWFNVQ